MKSLKEQIEFVDKKLIVLYGFKGITDYSHSINLTDPEEIKLDLTKLNGLIDEFRKVFHAKNFSLHKTQYKILTETQAVCLLKTCLEITSIPFDVSLKKNKRVLRLISKNNILDDYINTLKMSENPTFSENYKFEKTKTNSTPKYELRKELPNPNQIVKPFFSESNKFDNVLETENGLACVFEDVQEFNKSLKKYEEQKPLTMELLNESIKSTSTEKIELNCSQLLKMNGIHPVITIDLKDYGLMNKTIKNCTINFKPKMMNGNPVISQDFFKSFFYGCTYSLMIGHNGNVYEDNFINGQDIVIPDFLILSKGLEYHPIKFKLERLDRMIDYINVLDVEINITSLTFYKEIESKLERLSIEIPIQHKNLHNIFRIMIGMGGLAFQEWQTKEKFDLLKEHVSIVNNKLIDKTEEMKEIEMKEIEKMLETNSIKTEYKNLNGIKLNEYDENFIINNGVKILDKYDFINWTNSNVIPVNVIHYYKQIDKLNNIHCYKINVSGNYDSILELSIEIPNLEIFLLKDFIQIDLMDLNYNIYNINLTNALINFTNSNIKITFHNGQLSTYNCIGFLILKIKNKLVEKPIKEDNIKLLGTYYFWNKSIIKKYKKNIIIDL